MSQLPWGALFGMLFMTMGPIRAIAVYSKIGEADDAPGVRALAFRASAFVASAFGLTVLIGTAVLNAWGVSYPILIIAGGVVLTTLSLQSLTQPMTGQGSSPDPQKTAAAAVAFPGLFPPIAVSIPLIFSVPFSGWETRLGILGMGTVLIAANLFVMLRSKAIIRAVGPVPLQLFGAVFGVLQLALGLQFIANGLAFL